MSDKKDNGAAMSAPSKADMLSMIDVCTSTTNEGIRFGAGVALSVAVEALFASRTPAAAMSVALDVDWLSNVIRRVDGNHALGAGALAEKIVEALAAAPAAPVSADVRDAWEYSFIHSSAIGHGDSEVGPCLTHDRSVAYGVGCIKQRQVSVGADASQPAPVTQQAAPVASERDVEDWQRSQFDAITAHLLSTGHFDSTLVGMIWLAIRGFGGSTQPQPAAALLSDAQRDAIRDALSATLGDAMDCTRAWSAWGVGTMSDEDFQLVACNDERLEELVDAVAAAILAKTTGSTT